MNSQNVVILATLAVVGAWCLARNRQRAKETEYYRRLAELMPKDHDDTNDIP